MTRPALFVILSALALAPLTPVAAQDLLWTRQTGTTAGDFGSDAAVDSAGNIFISGVTQGSLGGPNAGDRDVFLAKYDASGTLLWTRQLGTLEYDSGDSVAVDGAGNAYITGSTDGNLGATNAGGSDAFLAKYDASGNLLWTRQIGTAAGDFGDGVAVDSAGNAYTVGSTFGNLGATNAGNADVFVAKYNPSGILLWTRQIGTLREDYGADVGVDGESNAYITGQTSDGLAGTSAGLDDTFLAKYDASGALLWARQFGTTDDDRGTSVAVDSEGNSYISGYTWGNLGGPNAGLDDVFLAKYDASGTQLWTRQIGTSDYDFSRGVAVDGAGNAYMGAGTFFGPGRPKEGDYDIFLAGHDASGTAPWTRQITTPDLDFSGGVAVDAAGGVYLTGSTRGSLGGPNAGDFDYFLAKFGPSLCPADFDHNGFVNGDDFDSLVLAFVNGDAAADFDHNGFVNGDDFDAYVAAFEAGC